MAQCFNSGGYYSMSSDDLLSSPFFVEDIQGPHSEYWVGRRKVAAAMRELIEAATITDIPNEDANELSETLLNLAANLRRCPQLKGVLAYAKAHGNLAVANHEILCVGGESHPMSPGLKHWVDGNVVRGRVSFNWSYEGPPQHTHGGWVAAVFDHFMGMAHMRCGKPGITGGLTIKYLKPTPLEKVIDLSATAEPIDARKTRVSASMICEGVTTATAEATFIQPRHMIFTEGDHEVGV